MMADQNTLHIGKLSVALIEHLVEPIIGRQFIDEAKKPIVKKELQESLFRALSRTEELFIRGTQDRKLADGLLEISLAELPSVQNALSDFYERPNNSEFSRLLEKKLIAKFPFLAGAVISKTVSEFIYLLRMELLNLDATIRDKIVAQAMLELAMRFSVMPLITPGPAPVKPGNLPQLPDLRTFTGREKALSDLKRRIGVSNSLYKNRITIMEGWPGAGKTTLSTVLAYQNDVRSAFPDGIFWTALGDTPDVMSALKVWAKALDIDAAFATVKSLDEGIACLRNAFENREALIIVDDVYEPDHGKFFRDIGGPNCVSLFTTRFHLVSISLAEIPDEDIYRLELLSDEDSLVLLKKIAPQAVSLYPHESLELVRDLEGLPLAIQVAGRMLTSQVKMGLSVKKLLNEIKDTTAILKEMPSKNRIALANETNLTIAALLQKSTDRLSGRNREYFTYLGVLAPKPASFDAGDIQAACDVADADPIIRELINFGLLEFDPVNQRYLMHALLTMHARYLLENS